MIAPLRVCSDDGHGGLDLVKSLSRLKYKKQGFIGVSDDLTPCAAFVFG